MDVELEIAKLNHLQELVAGVMSHHRLNSRCMFPDDVRLINIGFDAREFPVAVMFLCQNEACGCETIILQGNESKVVTWMSDKGS